MRDAIVQCCAYGNLNMAGAAADPWLGPRRGFVALAVDNGVGDWTCTLDRDTADLSTIALGGMFPTACTFATSAGIVAPMAVGIESVTASIGTATPQIRVRVLDTAGMTADPTIAIMLWRSFGT